MSYLLTSFMGTARQAIKSKQVSNVRQSFRLYASKSGRGLGRNSRTTKDSLKNDVSRDLEGLTAQVQQKGLVSLLAKPFAFTVAGCMFSFCGCTIWHYESNRAKVRRAKSRAQQKYGEWRQLAQQWWDGLGDRKVVVGIVALNTVVFAAWKVPRLAPIMTRYFVSSPFAAAPSLSMITSVFSHQSFWHYAINMYVLVSFSAPILQVMLPEHFVAVYLSGGLVASLASHVLKSFRLCNTFSLGASGAIMTMIGLVCTFNPDGRLAIAIVSEFFPHSFSADSAMKGLIAFDALGVLMGWRMFDHAAHLGGILFGLWYAKYGHQIINPYLKRVYRSWKDFRT